MDMVSTVADKFNNINLQQESDWAEVARDRAEESAVEDGDGAGVDDELEVHYGGR